MSTAPKLHQFAVSASQGNRALPPAAKGTRFLAAMIDGFASSVLSGACFALLKHAFGQAVVIKFAWTLVFPFLYFCLPVYLNGQTLGKMLMKIQVVPMDPKQEIALGQAMKRELLFKFISTIVFLLGYVRILTHPDGNGWHDSWSKTRVVSVRDE